MPVGTATYPALKWQIGDVTISKVTEVELHWPYRVILPGGEELAENCEWMKPDFHSDEGLMKLAIHALVVESGDKVIVVDTCIGNDKSRPDTPPFNELSTDFLDKFSQAGFDPANVDIVISTHLHVDHVGWNTMLVDGEWVPTFPNAEYLFVTEEFDFWRDEPQIYGPVFEDSVQPVVDAGLSKLVSIDHQIDSCVRLEPTTGHTPGHASVVIESGGECAVITGDMTHSPIQFAHPDLVSSADWKSEQAAATRKEAFKRWEDGRLVIGTHFAGRTAGRLVAEGSAWRFEIHEPS